MRFYVHGLLGFCVHSFVSRFLRIVLRSGLIKGLGFTIQVRGAEFVFTRQGKVFTLVFNIDEGQTWKPNILAADFKLLVRLAPKPTTLRTSH